MAMFLVYQRTSRLKLLDTLMGATPTSADVIVKYGFSLWLTLPFVNIFTAALRGKIALSLTLAVLNCALYSAGVFENIAILGLVFIFNGLFVADIEILILRLAGYRFIQSHDNTQDAYMRTLERAQIMKL